MAGRSYGYQYETSPRKLKPEYEKRPAKKKKPVKKANEEVKKKVDNKKQTKSDFRPKVYLFIKFILLFAIVFLIILKNSQMNEAFATIQNLKAQITSIQKENDQLEVSIQNSINLNNIEQAAKEKLGMQKRTNKQTRYINLSKKDYVETKVEEIILEEENSFLENIWKKIKNIF